MLSLSGTTAVAAARGNNANICTGSSTRVTVAVHVGRRNGTPPGLWEHHVIRPKLQAKRHQLSLPSYRQGEMPTKLARLKPVSDGGTSERHVRPLRLGLRTGPGAPAARASNSEFEFESKAGTGMDRIVQLLRDDCHLPNELLQSCMRARRRHALQNADIHAVSQLIALR